LIDRLTQCSAAPRALGAAGRSAFLATFLWLSLAHAPALAQERSLEESGMVEDRGAASVIDDKAFDCDAFRKLILATADGFKTYRGPAIKDSDAVTSYGATERLFGACEIVDKKKIGETIYSCQAEKLKLPDIKATVEACLGDKAFGYAGNENPNTPFLRYEPRLSDAKTRVVVLTTFGKQTLAIMNMR
jgi:hypothetical protein